MSRPTRAFTLIELLLAITVTSILAATVYASLMVATRTRSKAIETVSKDQSIHLALELLRRDIVAVPPPTGTLAGIFLGEDDNHNDTLQFTTTNAFLPPDNRLSDLINISIGLADDPQSDQAYMLVREITTNLLSATTTDPQTQVLARGVSGFDAAYSDGADWLDEWDSTQHDNTLPLAVRLTLYHTDESEDPFADEMATTLIVMIPAGQRGDTLFSGVTQ